MSTMSRVNNPELYEAVLEAAMNLVKSGSAPVRILPVNSYLYRASDSTHYMKSMNQLGGDRRQMPRSLADEIIRVRDYGTKENRFSGVAPRNSYYANGGCYLFTNQGAGLAEMMHYAEGERFPKEHSSSRVTPPPRFRVDPDSGRVSIPQMLGVKYIFQVRVTKPMQVADISLYGPNGGGARDFLRKIGQFNLLKSEGGASTSVEKQFPGIRLEDEVINQNGDYSVTRALGQAFAKFPQYFAGLIAQTARETERVGESGENVCLFGRAEALIEGLEVVRFYSFVGNEVDRYDVV